MQSFTMMELTCAFVLTLAGLVAGNPYGHGVKGGAGAKADATAVAGAFGGLGNIPTGAPFSGSFSKSSASSFASSSASSSASSFSYSGSGTAGLTGPGCTSGGCQKALNDGTSPGNSGSFDAGSGFPTQSGANAAAIAGASAGSYSQFPGHASCTNGDCTNQNAPDCQGSNCGNSNKCSSGQCGPSSSLIKDETEDNANKDIRVNVAGNAASKSNSDAQSTQHDKAANSYQSPTSGCSSGNCGSSLNVNPSYPHANINQSPGSNNLKPKCSTPYCDDITQSGGPSNGKTPSTHLTAPKEYPNPGTGSLPLNYNTATSQNTYLSPVADEKGSPCSSGKCSNDNPEGAYNPANSNSYTSNYLGPKFPNTEQKDILSDNKCKSGNCATNTYNNENPKAPNHLQSPHETQLSSVGNCAFGNCGTYSSLAPSHTSITYPDPKLPSYSTAPSGGSCASGNCGNFPSLAPSATGTSTYPTFKLPGYSQAPSSSGGNCISGNCGSYPSPTPSVSAATTYPGTKIPSFSQAPSSPGANCASGNCGIYPSSAPSSAGASTYPSYNIPTYSQTSSNTAGNCASGNCVIYPSSVPSSGSHSSSQFPVYSQGSLPTFTSTGPSASTNCGTPNCAQSPGSNFKPSTAYTPPFTTSSSPGYHNAAAGANAGAGTVGIHKPSSDIYPSSEEKLPTYTGGFGGPSGILKPNQYSLPSKPAFPLGQAPANPTSYPGSSTIPSTSFGVAPTSPTGPKPGSCTFGNCGSQPGPLLPSGVGANSGSSASASANTVVYSGGFGGPPGLLKPYDGGKAAGSLGSAGKSNAGYYNAIHTGNNGSGAAGTNGLTGAHVGSGGSAQLPYGTTGAGSGAQLPYGTTGSGSGAKLPYGTTGAGSGSQAGAAAHATAVAGAAAGDFNGGNNNDSGSPAVGCGGGCGGGSPYGVGHGLGGGIAGASAKSIAGAASGAGVGAYNHAGSFASSSASAHASAGSPTKGGYGK